jgi:hypothetical protein
MIKNAYRNLSDFGTIFCGIYTYEMPPKLPNKVQLVLYIDCSLDSIG